MAIYHLHAQVISRSSGRSAVAAAAYRAGLKLTDARTGEIHDYSHKRGIEHREIFAPANAPEWVTNRAALWNAVEASEKRKDAQLARELDIALPAELDAEQRLALVREFVQREFVARGMIADLCIHRPDRKSDERNHHAHVMVTLRSIDANGFGQKNRAWNDKALLQYWRESWERHANAALERAGQTARIDHRTLAAQGIEHRVPQIHLGPHVVAMEERGIRTGRGDTAMSIDAANSELEELQDARRHIESEIRTHSRADLGRAGPDHRAAGAEHGDAGRRPADAIAHDERSEQRAGGGLDKITGAGGSSDATAGVGDARGDASVGAADQVSGAAFAASGGSSSGSGGGGRTAVSQPPVDALPTVGSDRRSSGGAYERVLDLAAPLRGTDMQDRTVHAVERQLEAMGCALFEVGVRSEKGMLIREWDAAQVRKAIPWLKRHNAQGADIYIRPARSVASSLVLVDDLSDDVVRSLDAQGLSPVLVTETSRGNFQVWIRLTPEAQPPAVRTAVARQLAQQLNADMNSADYAHFGRLAGFTNRKPEREINGRQPFVLVERADPGAVAQRGADLVRDALRALRDVSAQHAQAARARASATAAQTPRNELPPAAATAAYRWHYRDVLKRQGRQSGDLDLSRVDSMIAVRLRVGGFSQSGIESTLRALAPTTRPASDTSHDWDDYAARTARYAYSAAGDAQAERLAKYRDRWPAVARAPQMQFNDAKLRAQIDALTPARAPEPLADLREENTTRAPDVSAPGVS